MPPRKGQMMAEPSQNAERRNSKLDAQATVQNRAGRRSSRRPIFAVLACAVTLAVAVLTVWSLNLGLDLFAALVPPLDLPAIRLIEWLANEARRSTSEIRTAVEAEGQNTTNFSVHAGGVDHYAAGAEDRASERISDSLRKQEAILRGI